MTEAETFFTLSKLLRSSLTTFVVLLTGLHAPAQIAQVDRFELVITRDEESLEVVSAADSGLFITQFVELNKIQGVQLMRLDSALNQRWAGIVPLKQGSMVVGKKVFLNHLYILTRSTDYRFNDLSLHVINISNGEYFVEPIRGYIPFGISEFHLTRQGAIIGGYFNNVPLVMHYSFRSRQSRVLGGIFNEPGELTQIRIRPDYSFDVVISSKNNYRKRTLWVKTYDAEGGMIKNYALRTEENRHLLFGRLVQTSDGKEVVAGTYGTNATAFSKGIFVATIDSEGNQSTKYYNYGDLQNFFKYMRARKQQRVLERIERKKIRGKRIRFNYRLLVHELVPYKDHYIMLGEAFYPKYRNVNREDPGYIGMGLIPAGFGAEQRVFDGYQYTHAVVLGIDSKGNLLWDNSFEINDVKVFNLAQFVRLEPGDDQISLLYLHDNLLRSKVIRDSNVIEGKTLDPIKTLSDWEPVTLRKASDNSLQYWYGEFLFAAGYQTIVNNQSPGKPTQKVFFINKLKPRAN